MTFRFRKSDETVEAGFRRIACEQLDEALAAIRSPDLPPERVVHEVRQRCKALRGLIRLVRPVFPGYSFENEAFRDIAGLLARSRDGKILVDVLDALTAEPDEALDAGAIDRLRKRLGRHASKPGQLRQALDRCGKDLLAARVRAVNWSLMAGGWEAMSGGLTKTARAARRTMKALAESGNPDFSHAWRKNVKYHWQHVRLLRAIAPDAMRKRARRADKLAVMLGDRHDLDLFVKTVSARRRQSPDQATLDRLVARAERCAEALGEKALRRGERLLDRKPRKLVNDWAGQWREWAGEAAVA